MNLALRVAGLVLLVAAAGACSKNKCKLGSDAEKEAFGTLADMTQGAFSCDVEGSQAVGGFVQPNERCDVGSSSCVPTMRAIHADGAVVKDTAAKYKAFLEKAGWTVTDTPVHSQFANGKPIEGVAINGKKGDKPISVKVFPFGTDMVESTTMLADLK